MTSLVGDLATNPTSLDLDDKHNLSASGGQGEGDYDATDPDTIIGASGTGTNHGIWFDRDGVDPYQAGNWGAIDGGTYNTGGLYDVSISYHAVSSDLGTMFATVNGVQTGFYTSGWANAAPDFYPAGLSFKGNMAEMQVFAGSWWTGGACGPVYISDLTVTTPCSSTPPVPEPASCVLLALACGGVGAAWRKRRKA